jgi:phosphoribosylaminoimidazolecarboxamide formyltransferase/IMP cyclohydrolase
MAIGRCVRSASDLADLAEGGAVPIDLVCVNLYPFEEAVAAGASEAERTEKIDVGGPTMIRAAAKNWRHVVVLCDPSDIPGAIEEIRTSGGVSQATRRHLAAKAFARTASYDSAIRDDFAASRDDDGLPASLTPSLTKVTDLRYGENPHQRAALYAPTGSVPPGELPGGWTQHAGTELSYNNWIDLVAAAELAAAFDPAQGPCAVVVKHTNPCGVAVAKTQREAWESALACDPVSAFGGIAAFNVPLDGATAESMSSLFLEVVVAPRFDAEALETLGRKKRLRLVEVPLAVFEGHRQEWKKLPGDVVLVQDDPGKPIRTSDWTAASKRAPTDAEWRDLEFAWKVAASVKSNAIVFVRDGRVLGVGAGQMSRVDSVRIAVDKAAELGHDLKGSVVASDAFFPFADGPQRALAAGAVAIVQPGGSKRDDETIAAVDDAGAAMVFTSRRVFRH